jgi:hypothetical protein
MKQWRPQVDLARLSLALSEEILAADEQEVREVSGTSGHVLSGAAREVRNLIEAASEDLVGPDLVIAEGVCFRVPCARQH